MLYFLILSLDLLFIVAPFQNIYANNNLDSFLTYQNQEYKYTIKFPHDWTKIDSQITGYKSLVTFKNLNVKPPPEFEIVVKNASGGNATAIIERQIENLNALKWFKCIEVKETKVNPNITLYSITFVDDPKYDLFEYKSQLILFIHGQFIYQVSYKASLDTYYTYLPEFKKSLKTFEIIL